MAIEIGSLVVRASFGATRPDLVTEEDHDRRLAEAVETLRRDVREEFRLAMEALERRVREG